jgi:DNA-binding response OmpR family regulator
MARILVIDDENNIRMMVRIALEQSGHEVEVAADGPSGLEKFDGCGSFDLVLLDQRMPGMEGLDVLREMKARCPDSRIVMITAFGTIDLAVDAMKAGASDFLRKPFTTETLRGAVLGALMTEPRQPAPAPVPIEPEREEIAAPVEPSPLLYGLTTINGYHIESDPEAVVVEDGDMRYTFSVRHPSGETKSCIVLLPSHIVPDVKALVRRDWITQESRFWHALCEHVLSNYLYQHADYPPGLFLRVDEVDRSMRNWVKAAINASLNTW